MARVRSFAPVAGDDVRVLVLGSMPGAASLEAGQYYAHPRNAFWPLMHEIFGWPAALDYDQRIEALVAAGVALWDVLQSCSRPGSLDAAIDDTTIVVNDLEGFLRSHDGIRCICFNGAKADAVFRRHVLPALDATGDVPAMHRLPSTSPAHAALGFEQKLEHWRRAFGACRR